MLRSTPLSELQSTQTVLKAANFAAEKHAAQKRKGAAAEPYINHLLEVAYLTSAALAEPDTNLIVAALLHDVVEDCEVTNDELVTHFGDDVAALVAEVTDDKSLPRAERKRLQIASAPDKSARVQILKLADKISNLRAVLNSPPSNWTIERKQEYVEWARRVVDALSAPNPTLKQEFDRVYQLATRLQ